MPWCEQCSRFYTQSTLSTAGDCPSGHHVADPDDAPPVAQSSAPGRDEPGPRQNRDPEEKVRAPWHFWVLAGFVVLYLGWRLVQGIMWLF